MNNLLSAAWPYIKDGISYHHSGPSSHRDVRILQIYTEGNSELRPELTKHTTEELIHGSPDNRRYYLQLVVVSRSWKTTGTSHVRVAHYDVSQEDLNSILEYQGLATFFRQTRVDVAGVHTLSLSSEDPKEKQKGDYLGLIYDSYLGLWARYDEEQKQWQGIFICPETRPNLEIIARQLASFAASKVFMYLFATKFTIDYLSLTSGELPQQIAEIERHSGHHFSILRPVPATYAKLDKMSAEATGTANIVSYYKIVISHLADDLLECVRATISHQHEDNGQISQEVNHHIASLRQRLKALSTYLTYLEHRTDRQVTATLHLVNQANASTNLAVAHDTHAIALASKRDSSSMRMLAAVTTTFLPGAFVATLFSMNMFDWFAGNGDPIVSGRFWIYWCVTIPLTLLTMGFWRAREYGLGERGVLGGGGGGEQMLLWRGEVLGEGGAKMEGREVV